MPDIITCTLIVLALIIVMWLLLWWSDRNHRELLRKIDESVVYKHELYGRPTYLRRVK